MIVRIIFLGIVVALLVYLYRRLRQPAIEAPKHGYADTVSCARCGLTLPKDEALKEGDKYYCCQEHVPK